MTKKVLRPKGKHNPCGSCTLCCKLLDIPWMNSPAGQYCSKCVPNKGCSIYKNAPQKCLDFYCAYNQITGTSINLRPDKCKVIFEKLNDRLFLGTQDPDFGATENAKKQVVSFNSQGFSVIINDCGKLKFYISPQHSEEEIKKDFYKILEAKYGRTQL